MENYINCLELEYEYLKKEYNYWNSYVVEGMASGLLKNTRLKRIKERIFEIERGNVETFMLNESKLSRIWQHVEQNKDRQWAIISPERKGNTPNENKKNHEKIKKVLRTSGHGYVEMEGYWQECQDSDIPYEECPEDKLVPTVEKSYFIPNMPKKVAEKIGNYFEQDAVLYGGPKTDNKAQVVYKNGDVETLGKLNPDTVAVGFSKMRRGGTFSFGDRNDPGIKSRDFAASRQHQKEKEKKHQAKMSANQEFRKKAAELGDHRIKSSVSGKMIKLKSALKPNHPDYQTAIKYIRAYIDKK